MATSPLSEQDWDIRLDVYRFFVEHARPPTYAETARRLATPPDAARHAFRRLHQHHALFLAPDMDEIRMANPLSATPTAYRTFVNGHWLWANCAWDSFGIAAMLHADARIEAVFAHTKEAVTYTVEAGTLRAADGVVHFPLPFQRWYENLIHT